MDNVKDKLLHLSLCRNVGWKTIFRLLRVDPKLTSLYNLTETDFQTITERPKTQIRSILTDLHDSKVFAKCEKIKQSEFKIIAIFDKSYPILLKEIYEPPWLLYLAGNENLLQERRLLAVVGSRQVTSYGKEAIKSLFPELINNHFTIVSGLAKGVDTVAHQTALELGGKSIAVIAGGFNNIYPRENKQLADKMMKDHLIISEYHPYSRPERWHFPKRNRIISGLCWGTFVIEAGHRSGSFITADFALNEGREVFALPGNITSKYSIGTNRLIQKGAKLVMDSSDIITDMPIYL